MRIQVPDNGIRGVMPVGPSVLGTGLEGPAGKKDSHSTWKMTFMKNRRLNMQPRVSVNFEISFQALFDHCSLPIDDTSVNYSFCDFTQMTMWKLLSSS